MAVAYMTTAYAKGAGDTSDSGLTFRPDHAWARLKQTPRTFPTKTLATSVAKDHAPYAMTPLSTRERIRHWR
jgi:hypothetical protein